MTNPSGAPVDGICVDGFRVRHTVDEDGKVDWDWEFDRIVEKTRTDDEGAYALRDSDVDAVRFRDCRANPAYAPQWWKSARSREDARLVDPPKGATATHVDARLRPLGIVAGTVTTTSGEPIEEAVVMILTKDPESELIVRKTTDERGRFTAKGLSSGSYRTRTYGPGDDELSWDEKRTFLLKHGEVDVAEGTTTTIATTLQRAAYIGGTTSYAGSDPHFSPCILVFPVDGTSDVGASDGIGDYRSYGLPPGEYVVGFGRYPDGTCENGQGESWWNGKDSRSEADVITVREGEYRRGIDYTYPE